MCFFGKNCLNKMKVPQQQFAYYVESLDKMLLQMSHQLED